MAKLDIISVVNGTEVLDPFDANQMARHAALLSDRPPVRSVTKPAVNTLSNQRKNLHEASHGLVLNLLKRPIIRISVLEKDGNAGHVLHYNPGAPNKDDLIILASGRAGEEVLLKSVFEHGCSGDDEAARKIALRLSGGDGDAADTLLREAAAAARALVERYSSAIYKLSMRLAIKKELVLDEAESAIRECIAAFEKKPVELDAEWQRKIARARAEQELRKVSPKQGRVIRTYNFDNPQDVRDWNKQLGHEDLDREPIGFGVGHIVPGSYR